LSVVKR